MKKGFTLIELIVVVAIMLVIGALALRLPSRGYYQSLQSATLSIASLLREAQSDAMAQEQGTSWGVRFANATNTKPFYALFASSTYAASAVKGYYSLPSSVSYVTSTLGLGSTTDVVFSQISGAASISTTIGLYVPNDLAISSTYISVVNSGAISY